MLWHRYAIAMLVAGQLTQLHQQVDRLGAVLFADGGSVAALPLRGPGARRAGSDVLPKNIDRLLSRYPRGSWDFGKVDSTEREALPRAGAGHAQLGADDTALAVTQSVRNLGDSPMTLDGRDVPPPVRGSF